MDATATGWGAVAKKARARRGATPAPSRAATPAGGPASARPSEGAIGTDEGRGAPSWAAVTCVAALLVTSAAAYSPGLFAPFYIPEVVLELLLVLALGLLLVLKLRSSSPGVPFDVIDLAAAVFCLWQLLTVFLSPAPWVAFFGFYNRGHGALFWMTIALALISTRRLLQGARSHRALVWVLAAILVLSATVAVAQAAGATTLWGAVARQNRVTGTTGNAVHLGGLGLLAVWLVGGIAMWPRRTATRWATVAGAAAGIVCVSLSVSRAAALGLLVCGVVLAVAWWRHRRGGLALLGALALLAAATSVVYALGPGDFVVKRLLSQRSVVSQLAQPHQDRTVRSHGSQVTSGRRVGSDVTRLMLWREALRAVAAYPVAGVGSGAFVVADRLYRPAKTRISAPWGVASDPHSLPLLIASGSGLVGLLAGGVLVVLVVRRLWLVRRRGTRRPDDDHDTHEGRQAGRAAILSEATLVYLLGTGLFLLVSPVDATVMVPVVLLGALACGAPVAAQKLTWTLPTPSSPAVARSLWTAAAVAVAAVLLGAAWLGVSWWRADRTFLHAVREDSATEARRAADLWRCEPLYPLQAGVMTWRAGQKHDDAADVAAGRDLLHRGVRLDPTDGLGYADLARLDLTGDDVQAAVGTLRRGLAWNPHHPILQGLWGYAAFVAQSKLQRPDQAASLVADLRRLPLDTPDGWYWVAGVLSARGDDSEAAAALARANALAPKLTAWRYRHRLQ